MTDAVKNALAKELETTPDKITEAMSADIYEVLSCLKEVQREIYDNYRWWDTIEAVVELQPSLFVSYTYASSTGDSTPTDLGWERPPISEIHQVFPTTVTTTIYQ